MKKAIIIFIIFTHFCYAQKESFSLSTAEKVEWMKKNAQPINSIAFASANYIELHAIKKAIGDRSIVFLGEHSHGDGTTNQAKSEIVRFLHQEMGFSVLITEYDLYLLSRIHEFVNKRDEFLWYFMGYNNAYFPSSLKPLYQYIFDSWQTPRPLKIAGLDMTKDISEGMKLYFRRSISEVDSNLIHSQVWKSFESHLLPVYDSTFTKELASFYEEVIYFTNAVEKKALIDERYLYLQRNLWNAYNYAYFMVNTPPFPRDNEDELITNQMFDAYRLRDSLMAENLLWHIEQHYKNKKIIVWTSTYHISRNIDNIKKQSEYIKKAIPMGHYVWQKHKKDIYSIAFIAYGGEKGSIRKGALYIGKDGKPTRTPHSIKKLQPAAEESIEAVFKGTQYPYAFLDISKGDKEYQWLKGPNLMYPTFDKPYKTDWTKVYDGLFYIEKMEPNIKIPIEEITRVPKGGVHGLFMKYAIEL